MTPEQKIQELRKLVDLIDRQVTKEDFTAEFGKVLEFVKNLKEANSRAMAAINERIALLSSRLKETNDKELNQIKSKINNIVLARIGELEKAQEEKLSIIDAKIQTIKNGKDADENAIANRVIEAVQAPLVEQIEKDLPTLGEQIRDGLELLQGESRLDKTAIRGLDELFEEIKKIAIQSKNIIGGGLTRGVADGLYAPLGSLGGDFEVESGTIAAGTTVYTFLNSISKVYSFNVGSQYIQPSVYSVLGANLTIDAADATGWDGLAYTLIYKKA